MEDAECNNNITWLIINTPNLIHLCEEYVHIIVSHLNMGSKHTLKPSDGNDRYKWDNF